MTAGFYKKQDDELLYATNIVEGNGYVLLIQEKDTYTFPIDGWSWFESEESANEELPIVGEPIIEESVFDELIIDEVIVNAE